MTQKTNKPAQLTAQEIINRAEFKEAYYVIGDKRYALKDIIPHIDDKDARMELVDIIALLDTVRGRLSKWADTHLQKWD